MDNKHHVTKTSPEMEKFIFLVNSGFITASLAASRLGMPEEEFEKLLKKSQE